MGATERATENPHTEHDSKAIRRTCPESHAGQVFHLSEPKKQFAAHGGCFALPNSPGLVGGKGSAAEKARQWPVI